MGETETNYKHGDIVWVKLGNCWWPGEVVGFDECPEAIRDGLGSRPPVAVVKFFQEDAYEYPSNKDKIFPYNCERKDEFLKKGLDMHRAKKSNMQTFPADIKIAQEKSGGNVDVLDDPKFAPQKRDSYGNLFGAPKVKTTPKIRRSRSTPAKMGSATKNTHITHPRFTGARNDHSRTILLQHTKKEDPNAPLKCPTCGFESMRIDALALHTKTHLKTDPLFHEPGARKKGKKGKRGPRKMKMTASKTNTIDEDLALLVTMSEDEQHGVIETKKKRKRKRAPPKDDATGSAKRAAPNITNDLLAEWDDGDDSGDDNSASESPMKSHTASSESDDAKTDKKAGSENGAKSVVADEADFSKLLEATKVPDLPALPKVKKDDDDLKVAPKTTPEVATKLTNPKKRFVKSFEDFEQSLKEKEERENLNKASVPEKTEDVPVVEEKKSTRRSSVRIDAKGEEKPLKPVEKESSVDTESKVEDTPVEETSTRSRRRGSARMEKEVEKPKQPLVELPIESKEPLKNETDVPTPAVEAEKMSTSPRRTPRAAHPVEELRKSPRKLDVSEDKEQDKVEEKKVASRGKKYDSEHSESTGEESDRGDVVDKEKKKQKEDRKARDSPKRDPKKDDKASRSDAAPGVKAAKTKPTEEKSEKKIEAKPKPKIKEKVLTEIDVFGSLREQENEKYKKKSEDGQKRETRASRSKSRHAKEEQEKEEQQVNNGSEASSPLINKMKNQLMNMLSSDLDAKGKSPVVEDSSSSRKDEKKKAEEAKKKSSDKKTEEVKRSGAPTFEERMEALKSPEARRHSLRNTSSSFDRFIDDVKPADEKVDMPKKTVPTKAEVKSAPKPDYSKSGPKTYLRASRADPVKTPVAPSKVAQTTDTPEPEKLDAEARIMLESVIGVPIKVAQEDTSTKTKAASKAEEDLPEVSRSSTEEWMNSLTTTAKKADAPLDVQPTKYVSSPKAAPIVKTPGSPVKQPVTPTSPVKPTPVATDRMPSATKPSSPAKAHPLSPVKATPASPMKPLKSPPIILNKDAPKFAEPLEANNGDKSATAKSPRHVPVTVPETSTESVLGGEVEINDDENKESASTEMGNDSLDLLASVSAQNKPDLIEKNITFVPEDILAEGQVEIATIIEGGTEKVASIPNVEQPKETPSPIAEEVAKPVTEATLIEVTSAPVAPAPQKPIILNSSVFAEQESTSKLLDILTDNKRGARSPTAKPQQVPLPKIANPKFDVEPKKPTVVAVQPKQTGVRIMGTGSPTTTGRTKPTILSDTLIRPADSVVSVKKVKRAYDDIEDIDAFIITKVPKNQDDDKRSPVTPPKTKPKILEHTIITAGGQVLHPVKKKQTIIHQQTIKVPAGGKSVEEKVRDLLNSPKAARDEDAFDIDNMPIVLGDQLLTAENIEAMTVVVQEPPKTTPALIKKAPVQQQQQIKLAPAQQKVATTPVTKTMTKIVKGNRMMTTTASPVVKHQPTILATGKQGRFVIMPSQTSTGNKYTVGKRPQQIVKKPTIIATAGKTPEPTGNKIMVLTNNQGQQQRVILTPEQQKMMQGQRSVEMSIVKTASPTMQGKKIVASPSTASVAILKKQPKLEPAKLAPQTAGQKPFSLKTALAPMKGQTRTVIIKNQQGEIVNRIHGTSDEDIEKQVQQQLDIINKAATVKAKAQQQVPVKRVFRKTVAEQPRMMLQSKQMSATNVSSPASRTTAAAPPPLAPISQAKKVEQPKPAMRQQKPPATTTAAAASTTAKVAAAPAAPAVRPATKSPEKAEGKEERAPKQLVIQDAMGNETTIVEGQILALPSETVDGQPQSYMLVTLDETGSLTPLNNEALMSLDPNLNLSGGDLSNMVLQIEGTGSGGTTETVAAATVAGQPEEEDKQSPTVHLSEIVETGTPITHPKVLEPTPEVPQSDAAAILAAETATGPTEQMHAVACSINKGDQQQQLIITGDPASTQKFLESLTEGNPEIASLLAQATGDNILIHTDGNQILINTDADSSMLMSLNAAELEPVVSEAATYSAAPKNQDILAAALADTDVFQQEQAKVTQSQTSPGYPLAANNVLETSTVNSPIMTPLEQPSTSSKKLDTTDVLHPPVSKSVPDLPITITDPNIAQTVANQQQQQQQQVALELPLTMTTTTTVASTEGFYIDEAASISMPLLTEDTSSPAQKDDAEKVEETKQESSDKSTTAEYILAAGDMCAISNQMSSLSEPPPDMFDFQIEHTDGQFCNATVALASGSSKRILEDGADGADESGKRAKLD